MPASIAITGRLARDVEFRYAGSTLLAILTIPTDDGFGDRKVTTWWTCEAWGKQAERIQNANNSHGMYNKGDNVFVTGSPKVRTYQKNDGTTGFSADINASAAEMVFAPKDASASSGGSNDDVSPF